jgi:hypothetical protein
MQRNRKLNTGVRNAEWGSEKSEITSLMDSSILDSRKTGDGTIV